jgi:hypothetical protein
MSIRDLFEAVLVFGVLRVVAGSTRIQHICACSSWRPRIVTALILTGILSGHFWLNAFPFPRWNMYTRVDSSDATVFEFVGIAPDGSRLKIVPSTFLPSMAADRLIILLNREAAAWTGLPNRRGIRGDAQSKKRLEACLRVLAKLYNDSSSASDVTRIELEARTVFTYPDGSSASTPEVLLQVALRDMDLVQ